MAKKNKLAKIKDLNCLNCGYPFFGNEIYCPECGQKNKGDRITFVSFIKEVFNGFTSWDAKFWKTLFPLLTKPGKVSKDYIEGRRARYTNPFRFYLTTSVIFFLILGLVQSYNKFRSLEGKEAIGTKNFIHFKENDKIDKDSLKTEVLKNIDTNLDSLITEAKKDTLKTDEDIITISGFKKFNSFTSYANKNPLMDTDKALENLKVEKTFSNKFWYSRARILSNLVSSKEETEKFNQEIISYFSIALFILLPIFALFLKLLYIRRKKTYVEHLIFTFHTQTVFFILLTIFYVVAVLTGLNIGKTSMIFSFVFMVYLFLAMRRFYEQGKLKTFIKFWFANITFLFLLGIGTFAIAVVAFAFY